MPSQTLLVTNTTYLQVPKLLPNRKNRSRSRSSSRSSSRPRSPERTSQQPQLLKPRPFLRPVSPPSPPPFPPKMTEIQNPWSHDLGNNGFNGGDIYTNNKTTSTTYDSNDTTPRTAPAQVTIGSPPNVAFSNNMDLSDYYTLSKTPSPPPQKTLRERLIGAWRLEAYVAYPTPTCKIQRPTWPMTKNVTGLIMYTPDGYMSAHMLIPGQMSFKRGEGEEPQWAEAGKRSFAYCGPYYISNEGYGRQEILRHTFQVCNLPGWVGDIQVRTWKFEEDDNVLVLGSEEPTEIKGDQRIPVLKWRRVKNNAEGSPPPPTPQIKVSGPGEP